MQQVGGARDSGVRTTFSRSDGEVRGKPYTVVKREEVATAAARRYRDKRAHCSGVGAKEKRKKRRAVHYTCASEDEEREGRISRKIGVVFRVPLPTGGPPR